MIPKIKKVNLGAQLIDTMVSLIENGTWQLGEKLPNEIELAASFNVSRNIMRESMKILESFGILDSKTGIGTYISENATGSICNMRFFESLKNNSSVEKLLETRLIIEPELAYYATLRITTEEIATLKEILDSDKEKHTATSFFHSDDFEFHRLIAKYSRNEILENLLITILEQLSADSYGDFNKYVDHSIKIGSFNDHAAVLNAIEKKDPLLAKEIMFQHLFARMKVINANYNTEMIHSKKIRASRLESQKK